MALSIRQEAKQEATQQVTLTPQLRRKLLTELHVYARLDDQVKVLEAAKAKKKDEIDKLRDQAGTDSLAVDGYKVTLVAPMRSTLDKKKLVSLGVSIETIENATVATPGRPYTRISRPGEKED